MFDKKEQKENAKIEDLKDTIDELYKREERSKELHIREIENLTIASGAKVSRLELDHELALKQKEFDIAHFKDAQIKKAEDANFELKQEIAVVKKENEMLIKITDLNADVIDVKDLVKNLIDKLPEVKISSLSVTAPATQSAK